MKAAHLWTFFWLRWRLRRNQLRRGGLANAILLALLAGLALAASLLFTLGGFALGFWASQDLEPPVLMLLWDGLAGAFLFFWLLGVLMDLQRAEALALDKFLHLPVSLFGAFFINYLSSLFSLTLVLFVPAMLSFSLGLALARGFLFWGLFPLVLAFVFLVTAVTYQLQSWLAALMHNPRRRRTILVLISLVAALLAQAPNLVHLWQRPAASPRPRSSSSWTAEDWRRLGEQYRLVNWLLPPGWLPAGAAALAEGHSVPALLAALGMGLLGVLSLRRSYRTVVRLYRGEVTRPRRPQPQTTPPAKAPDRPRLLERTLPAVPEQAAAVALATFCSLYRAPEVKTMFVGPLILLLFFSSLLVTSPAPPEWLRPLGACGGVIMIFLSLGPLVNNSFGLDRAAFRLYVLSPLERRHLLLGKNLAAAPFLLGPALCWLLLLQGFWRLRWDHLLALAPLTLALYLFFCLLANLLAVLAPSPVAPGSVRRTHLQGLPLLLHLLGGLFFPPLLGLLLTPLLLEGLLEVLGSRPLSLPIGLLGALLEGGGMLALYPLVLSWEGHWLAHREQKILEVVARRAE
jgi:ABC-2 type transport system permease protein